MVKKKLNGAEELVAIAIARSEVQHKDIMIKARKGFRQHSIKRFAIAFTYCFLYLDYEDFSLQSVG